MAEHIGGLLAWTTSIRSAMIDDPGRQLFEDQIQTQGFLFLDEYLDNILAESYTDGIIVDLLKTPGRRRDAPKKTRAAVAAASRVQNTISFSLDTDDMSKENFAPVNNFHKALLQAKTGQDNDNVQRHQSPQRQKSVPLANSPGRVQAKHKYVRMPDPAEPADRDDHFIEVMSSSPQPPIISLPDVDEEEHPFSHGPPVPLTQPRSDLSNELSIIAEDDEPAERSRISVQPPHASPAPHREPSPLAHIHKFLRDDAQEASAPDDDDMDDFHDARDAQMETDEFTRATTITVSDSTDTFQPVPLTESPTRSQLPESQSRNYPTGTLPQTSHIQAPANGRDATPVPLPSMPTASSLYPSITDLTVPLRDHDSSESGLTRKPSLSHFPSLPAPSPLKKSTRLTREPSIGTTLQAPAPPAGAAGKRSSWLTKAREAKAMEITQKRASVVSVGIAGTSRTSVNFSGGASGGGVKRKSGEMLGGLAPSTSKVSFADGEERRTKVPKVSTDIIDAYHDAIEVEDTVAFQLEHKQPIQSSSLQVSGADIRTTKSADDVAMLQDQPEGVLDFFKRTVVDAGARVEKSVAQPLGDAAASELARARAAAEARVAERHKVDTNVTEAPPVRPSFSAPSLSLYPALPEERSLHLQQHKANEKPSKQQSDMRLSVSDLVSQPTDKKSRSPPTLPSSQTAASDLSTSTTPPNSPPPPIKHTGFIAPPGPVFNKPPPVFVPPSAAVPAKPQPNTGNGIGKDFSFQLPTSTTFPLRGPFNIGLQPYSSKLSVSPRQPSTHSGASTQASVFSDAVFDTQDGIRAWAPRTQDTDYGSQDSLHARDQPDAQMNGVDDDDSWQLDDKLAVSNQMWTPFGTAAVREDSMTWSTLPTQSERGGDSGLTEQAHEQAPPVEEDLAGQTGAFDRRVDDMGERAMVIDSEGDGWERDITEAGKSTVSLVETKTGLRSKSQLSVASSSGQSSDLGGFFGQASKLVSSMLGVSKKSKAEPLKSIQLAAAAAKKHQEEQDRKATRLREMEARRQAALQRKAEEEKVKAGDAEKKLRDEADRRKKDREEHTGKRPLKVPEQKAPEEDNTKKRKMVVEIQKTKPPSKEKKEPPAPSRLMKPSPAPQTAKKSILKQPSTSNLNSASAAPSKAAEGKTTKSASASSKGKGKAPAPKNDEELDDRPPSKVIQSQMAARVKSQVQASKQPEEPPRMASELIDLPEPNSEYSDSDDEDRPRGFDAPEWAQSPELRAALESQSHVNPDDIFGPVRPLRMEDMFRTRHSRFRARTSSANWSGPDGLTQEEDREYARRMGFRGAS